MRDRIIMSVKDDNLRAFLMKDSELTLQTAIDVCRAHEFTSSQMKIIAETPALSMNVMYKEKMDKIPTTLKHSNRTDFCTRII